MGTKGGCSGFIRSLSIKKYMVNFEFGKKSPVLISVVNINYLEEDIGCIALSEIL